MSTTEVVDILSEAFGAADAVVDAVDPGASRSFFDVRIDDSRIHRINVDRSVRRSLDSSPLIAAHRAIHHRYAVRDALGRLFVPGQKKWIILLGVNYLKRMLSLF